MYLILYSEKDFKPETNNEDLHVNLMMHTKKNLKQPRANRKGKKSTSNMKKDKKHFTKYKLLSLLIKQKCEENY